MIESTSYHAHDDHQPGPLVLDALHRSIAEATARATPFRYKETTSAQQSRRDANELDQNSQKIYRRQAKAIGPDS